MANRKRHADVYCPRDDEWNREIRSAFSKMRRKYRVSCLPVSRPSLSRLFLLPCFHCCCGTMRNGPREMTMPIRLFWKSSVVRFWGGKTIGFSLSKECAFLRFSRSQRGVAVLFHVRPRDFDFRIPGVWCHLTGVNRITSPSNFLLVLRRRILGSRGWHKRDRNFYYLSIRRR